ncbi:Ribosomal protein L19 family protein, partial [Prunus dulcis]
TRFVKMQSLSAGIRLVQRQRIDSSKIAHFRSIGAYPLSSGSGFSSLASDGSASAKIFESSLGLALPKTTRGFQTETSTSSSNSMLFKSPRPGLLPRETVSPPFPSRCITTGVNPVESATQDSTMSGSDIAPRIKFKRLDKTAKHIMQILDKEALEEVREVPDNKRRVSILKGTVIARRNAGLNTTIRIRRLMSGVGVESLLPLYSPNIKEIKVLDKKRVRRAKLYYIRDKMNALKNHAYLRHPRRTI